MLMQGRADDIQAQISTPFLSVCRKHKKTLLECFSKPEAYFKRDLANLIFTLQTAYKPSIKAISNYA